MVSTVNRVGKYCNTIFCETLQYIKFNNQTKMFLAISLVGKLFLIGGRDFEDFYVINPFNSETFPPARDPAINTLELYFIF